MTNICPCEAYGL